MLWRYICHFSFVIVRIVMDHICSIEINELRNLWNKFSPISAKYQLLRDVSIVKPWVWSFISQDILEDALKITDGVLLHITSYIAQRDAAWKVLKTTKNTYEKVRYEKTNLFSTKQEIWSLRILSTFKTATKWSFINCGAFQVIICYIFCFCNDNVLSDDRLTCKSVALFYTTFIMTH